LSPVQAVAKAASALAPWFRFESPPSSGRARLESKDPQLPDVELSLVRDRRLFSRTWPLVIEAADHGSGPSQGASIRLHRPRLRGSPALRGEPGSDPWTERFAGAGLLAGAMTMTGIQDLRLTWAPDEQRWRLRLQTLAGALVGTAPGSSIAVPMEPEDIEGLLRILRAFRSALAAP
jgi:hypothetical protein